MGKRTACLAALLLVAAIPANAQETAALIAAGDALYEQRADPGQARLAAEKYGEAARRDPASYEARWKTAKALFYLGRISGDNREKRREFFEAVGQAKEAVRVNPEGVEGHFWLGTNYAEYGQARGVLKSLFLRDDIVREMNAVLRIDPSFGCGAAHITLGRIYFKVPAFFGGSLKKSREHLERARDICPRETTTLLYLAETYWEMKERSLAVETLEQLLRIEPYEAILPEAVKDKAEAERLLRKYKGQDR
ncbi:MAG: TRAP transporter TatT component family protein [Candidatus Aminicenantes bacterium]|nr:TRAP transporter TatT component family protein [Candidatus Aminicenantes bacterium]